MRMRMECWILTSKNLAKLKQYYYFYAEFLEVRYLQFGMGGIIGNVHCRALQFVNPVPFPCNSTHS